MTSEALIELIQYKIEEERLEYCHLINQVDDVYPFDLNRFSEDQKSIFEGYKSGPEAIIYWLLELELVDMNYVESRSTYDLFEHIFRVNNGLCAKIILPLSLGAESQVIVRAEDLETIKPVIWHEKGNKRGQYTELEDVQEETEFSL